MNLIKRIASLTREVGIFPPINFGIRGGNVVVKCSYCGANSEIKNTLGVPDIGGFVKEHKNCGGRV